MHRGHWRGSVSLEGRVDDACLLDEGIDVSNNVLSARKVFWRTRVFDVYSTIYCAIRGEGMRPVSEGAEVASLSLSPGAGCLLRGRRTVKPLRGRCGALLGTLYCAASWA